MKDFVVVEEVQDPASEMDLTTARLMHNPFVQVGDTVSIPQQPAAPSKAHLAGHRPAGA